MRNWSTQLPLTGSREHAETRIDVTSKQRPAIYSRQLTLGETLWDPRHLKIQILRIVWGLERNINSKDWCSTISLTTHRWWLWLGQGHVVSLFDSQLDVEVGIRVSQLRSGSLANRMLNYKVHSSLQMSGYKIVGNTIQSGSWRPRRAWSGKEYLW